MSRFAGKAYRSINGATEDLWEGFSWPCLFAGFMWFISKGMWGWGVIALILAICTFGIAWLIFPFFANGLHAKALPQKGYFNENNWREWEPAVTTEAVDPRLERQQEVSPFADEAGMTIRCPFCAMTIKSESTVCPCCGRNLSQSMKLNISYAAIAGICMLGMFALVGKFNEAKIEEPSKPAVPQGIEDRSSIATAVSQGIEDRSSQATAVLQGAEGSSSQAPNVSQGAKDRSAKARVHTWADSNRSAPTFADSPETVRRKYGSPDEDESTQYANPRPPRVTRWIVYRKEKVRLTFTPDSPIGTPPPYKKWKPSYFQDAQSNAFILADEAKKRLAHRAVRR